MGLFAAGLIVVLAAGAVLRSPWREPILRKLSSLCGSGFRCRVEQLGTDQPLGRDQIFQVQMTGRIPTPYDNCMTDVKVEISDITDGSSDLVLSADPKFQSGRDAVFNWITCNGEVPKRNAVLARWITAAQIPCHILRFACRGRRRLHFRISVLSSQSGQVLTGAQASLDYVNCSDGYRERQERKLDVLKSTLLLAAMAGLERKQIAPEIKNLMGTWLDDKAAGFPPASKLKSTIDSIQNEACEANTDKAADRLLAWGDQADKEEAITLSIRTAAALRFISADRFRWLMDVAGMLSVRHDRFLVFAQKAFLSSNTALENPGPVLGIDDSMPSDQVLKKLNEEYRKWNARVTHPDIEIRNQADRILSLIADLRTHYINTNAAI